MNRIQRIDTNRSSFVPETSKEKKEPLFIPAQVPPHENPDDTVWIAFPQDHFEGTDFNFSI